MKKGIFYPNLFIQDEITTEEDYRNALLNFYQEKYSNVDSVSIDRLIVFTLCLVYGVVGSTIGYFQNASTLADNVKRVASFERDAVIEICKTNHLSGKFFTLYAFYSGSIEDMKFNLEKKEIAYSEKIATIAQEITKKIIDDIGAATRSQLTFVEKYTKKPGESKVQWANRVHNSSAENLIAKKDTDITKLVRFSPYKPVTISGQTGAVK